MRRQFSLQQRYFGLSRLLLRPRAAAGADEEVLQELCSDAGGDISKFSPRLCSTQLLQQQQLLLQHKIVALQQKAVELAELLQQQQQHQQPQKKQKQQGDTQVLHALQQQISNSQQTYGRLAPVYLIISNELHQVGPDAVNPRHVSLETLQPFLRYGTRV